MQVTRDWERLCRDFHEAKKIMVRQSEFCQEKGLNRAVFNSKYKAWCRQRGEA